MTSIVRDDLFVAAALGSMVGTSEVVRACNGHETLTNPYRRRGGRLEELRFRIAQATLALAHDWAPRLPTAQCRRKISFVFFGAREIHRVPNFAVLPNSLGNYSPLGRPGKWISFFNRSIDSTAKINSYAWTQTSGPTVALVDGNTAQASFVGPQVTAATALTVELAVKDAHRLP
jgi:hypothetical protein